MEFEKAGYCHLQKDNELTLCVIVWLPDCNCLFCPITNSILICSHNLVVGEVTLPPLHVALLPCPRVMIKPGKIRILTGQ